MAGGAKRGAPPGRTERIRPVAEAVAEIAGRVGGGAPRRLDLAWSAAVGAALSRRTRILGLSGGVLDVAVSDSAWQLHLQAVEGEILSRLSRILGSQRIQRIRWKVRSVGSRARPRRKPPRRAPPPADARRVAEVQAAGVRDPKLAASIARAMQAADRARAAAPPASRSKAGGDPD